MTSAFSSKSGRTKRRPSTGTGRTSRAEWTPAARKYDYTAGPLYPYYGRSARAIICPTLALTAGLDTGDLSRMASSGRVRLRQPQIFDREILPRADQQRAHPARFDPESVAAVVFGDSQISRNATGPAALSARRRHGKHLRNRRLPPRAESKRLPRGRPCRRRAVRCGRRSEPLRQFRRPCGEPRDFSTASGPTMRRPSPKCRKEGGRDNSFLRSAQGRRTTFTLRIQ